MNEKREWRYRAHVHHMVPAVPGTVATCRDEYINEAGESVVAILTRAVPAWGVYDIIIDAYEGDMLVKKEVERTRSAGPLVWVPKSKRTASRLQAMDDALLQARGGVVQEVLGLVPAEILRGLLDIECPGHPLLQTQTMKSDSQQDTAGGAKCAHQWTLPDGETVVLCTLAPHATGDHSCGGKYWAPNVPTACAAPLAVAEPTEHDTLDAFVREVYGKYGADWCANVWGVLDRAITDGWFVHEQGVDENLLFAAAGTPWAVPLNREQRTRVSFLLKRHGGEEQPGWLPFAASYKIDTGINAVNDLLGGGLVPGSIAMIYGAFAAELALQIARSPRHNTLVVSACERPADGREAEFRSVIMFDCTTDTDRMVGTIREYCRPSWPSPPRVVIVDNVCWFHSSLDRGHRSPSGPGLAGSASQVKYLFAEMRKQVASNVRRQPAIVLIGPTDENGRLAGPKELGQTPDILIEATIATIKGHECIRLTPIRNRVGPCPPRERCRFFLVRDSNGMFSSFTPPKSGVARKRRTAR